MGEQGRARDKVVLNHERRIGALEAHLADLEQRLNERGIFSGAPTPEADRLASLSDAELIEEAARNAGNAHD